MHIKDKEEEDGWLLFMEIRVTVFIDKDFIS